MYHPFRYDRNVKYADCSGWTLPNDVTYSSSYYQFIGDCYNLRDLIGLPIPSTYKKIGLNGDENLSHESIMRVINALPDKTGQSGYTLHLTTININKLTTAEKAIATNKNWSLAN